MHLSKGLIMSKRRVARPPKQTYVPRMPGSTIGIDTFVECLVAALVLKGVATISKESMPILTQAFERAYRQVEYIGGSKRLLFRFKVNPDGSSAAVDEMLRHLLNSHGVLDASRRKILLEPSARQAESLLEREGGNNAWMWDMAARSFLGMI